MKKKLISFKDSVLLHNTQLLPVPSWGIPMYPIGILSSVLAPTTTKTTSDLDRRKTRKILQPTLKLTPLCNTTFKLLFLQIHSICFRRKYKILNDKKHCSLVQKKQSQHSKRVTCIPLLSMYYLCLSTTPP